MMATPDPDPMRREQIEALHEEVDRLAEKYRAPAGALLLRGPDARRGRPAAEMPGRHGELPAVAGPGPAPGSPDPPGIGPARGLGGCKARIADRLGGHARRAGRGHDQGRDESRGRQGR